MLQFTLLVLLAATHACSAANETTLQADLMNNYNTNVAPKDGNTPVTVNVSMILLAIIEFNAIKETITVNANVELTWIDVNLAWDPAQYGNVTETVFKQKEVWMPDLFVSNYVNGVGAIGEGNIPVLVTSNGRVLSNSLSTMETLCKVNTEYFPYDKQTCSIQVLNRAQTPSMIHVNLPQSVIGQQSYTINGQWDLTSTSADLTVFSYLQLINFRLNLARRPEYYVTSLIVPILIVSALNCFVLILPNGSGEKISFSITVFLSYMVLMTFTTENLPKTSEYDPYIVNFISTMLGLSFASVTCSVFSLLIQSKFTDKEKRNDDVTDDVSSSRDSDAPIISVRDGRRSSSGGNVPHKVNPHSNVINVKSIAAWDGKQSGSSGDSREYHSSNENTIRSRMANKLCFRRWKTRAKKSLKYFDALTFTCISLATAFVASNTMLTLTSQE